MTQATRIFFGAIALTGFALLTTLAPARAQDDPWAPLRDDPHIAEGVLIVAIGEVIRDSCPGIEDRRARSLLFLNGLVNRARRLGYSLSEIEDFVDDPTEKAAVEARAMGWFAQAGATFDDPETICAIARREIEGRTAIGRLLRDR